MISNEGEDYHNSSKEIQEFSQTWGRLGCSLDLAKLWNFEELSWLFESLEKL